MPSCAAWLPTATTDLTKCNLQDNRICRSGLRGCVEAQGGCRAGWRLAAVKRRDGVPECVWVRRRPYSATFSCENAKWQHAIIPQSLREPSTAVGRGEWR